MAYGTTGAYDSLKYQVFILCDQSDNEWAEKCRSMLMHPPYQLTVSTRSQNFIGGRTVQSNYDILLAKSSKLLLVLTPEFLENVWTPYLVPCINNHLDKIIPVMLRTCQIPEELKETVYIEVIGDDFLFFRRLFEALQSETVNIPNEYDHIQTNLPPEPPQRTITGPPLNSRDSGDYEEILPPSVNDGYEPVDGNGIEGGLRDDKKENADRKPAPRLPPRDRSGYLPMTGRSPIEEYDVPVPSNQADNDAKIILEEKMLNLEYFMSNPERFISQFCCTKGEIRSKAESFLIRTVLYSTSESTAIGRDLKLLTFLANCNSTYVVKRALDTLLDEIFLSIGDYVRCRNILEAEKMLREYIGSCLMVEHKKAKAQRMTTYCWLLTLVLLHWDKLNCPREQCDKIRKFDKTLESIQSHRDFRERNLFQYGVLVARESIKRITSRKRELRGLAERHLRTCENILNSPMETAEIERMVASIGINNWLDLHICLVHLQQQSKRHQFTDDRKPITLMQKLISTYRARYTSRPKQRLTNTKCDWRFELLVYRVLLKLMREAASPEIIKQIVNGSPGYDGIRAYWERDYGLIQSPFALACLRKLCRKCIFVSDPGTRKVLVDLVMDDSEDLIPIELSINHLNSLYRDLILDVSNSNSSKTSGNYGVAVLDVKMSSIKCSLKLYQHSKNQLLCSDFPNNFLLFRGEIETLNVLNDVSVPCPNVVRLLASRTELPAHIIIERANKGDLLSYLHSKKENPTEARLLKKISLDVCSAMIFLSVKGIIHRDLRAARVSVFENKEELVCKLGDFSLSVLSNFYPNSSSKNRQSIVITPNDAAYTPHLSIRWMAVESLRIGEFSTCSDVWSFGVLLFEIFTLGCQPYLNMPNGMSLEDDEEVKEFVLDGHRLELYLSIPRQMKLIIESTWIENRDGRPTFADLKLRMEEIEFDEVKCVHPETHGIYYRSNNDNLPTNLSKTVCPVVDCSGACLTKSDQPVIIGELDTVLCTKEFVPLEYSSHIQRLSGLKHRAIATIEQINTHIENLELITGRGDMGSLVDLIKAYGCSMENTMSFLTKIAEGIAYLHGHRFIHCDLRAEAISIYSNGDIKIGRLGRASSMKASPYGESQTASIERNVPKDSIRWSSLEVLKEGRYSEGSDMWAFGVVMWEVFTLIDIHDSKGESNISSTPYHNLTTIGEISSYLERGNRLFKPDSCPHWVFLLMMHCWFHNRLRRPPMRAILDCLTHRRPFESWILKKWREHKNDHIYENWPDIHIEQNEELEHVLPTRNHSTDQELHSLSNEEFIGDSDYTYCIELPGEQPRQPSKRKPVPHPRKGSSTDG